MYGLAFRCSTQVIQQMLEGHQKLLRGQEQLFEVQADQEYQQNHLQEMLASMQ